MLESSFFTKKVPPFEHAGTWGESHPFWHRSSASCHNSSYRGGFAPAALSKKRSSAEDKSSSGEILFACARLSIGYAPDWDNEPIMGKPKTDCFAHFRPLIPNFSIRAAKRSALTESNGFETEGALSNRWSVRALLELVIARIRFNCLGQNFLIETGGARDANLMASLSESGSGVC